MLTIKVDVVTEQIINKSRFITYLFQVTNEDEAKSKLAEIRREHSDATHNCYSYIIGKTANIMKFSDDGEPSGTAGIIIADVLQKNNLTNVLVIVTRYYGGIKLGAGGLVRAYSSSTAMAVEAAVKVKIIEYSKVQIICSYNTLGVVEKYISDYELLSKDFGQNINITITVPSDEVNDLELKLIDITKNQININIISE